MYLYKCKCGLLTSEEFQACPSCSNKEKKMLVDTYDLDEGVFMLTMEDVEYVMDNNISDDLADKLKSIDRADILDMLKYNLEIPWTEYIECTLEAVFGDD